MYMLWIRVAGAADSCKPPRVCCGSSETGVTVVCLYICAGNSSVRISCDLNGYAISATHRVITSKKISRLPVYRMIFNYYLTIFES